MYMISILNTKNFKIIMRPPLSIIPTSSSHIILATLGLLTTLALVIFFVPQIDAISAQTMSIQNKNADVMSTNSTVSVLGTACIKVKPDRVVVSIGVETTDKTAKASSRCKF